MGCGCGGTSFQPSLGAPTVWNDKVWLGPIAVIALLVYISRPRRAVR